MSSLAVLGRLSRSYSRIASQRQFAPTCSGFHSSACSSSDSERPSSSEATAAVYAQTGDPKEVLRVKKLQVDPPDEGEIAIKFILAPINPADVNTIEGKYPLQPCLPGVPGHEAPPPRLGLSICEADPGLVVQNGANSAVGQMVIQLARSMGVRTINIIRERDDWDETVANLKAQGADVVTTEQDARQNAKAAGLKGAVLGLNCVGGSSALTVAKLLKEGGTHVTYGGMSLEPVSIPTALLMFKDLTLRGFWLSGKWAMNAGTKGKADMIDRIVDIIQNGDLKIDGKWAMNAGTKGKADMIDRIVDIIQNGDLKIEATKSTIFPLEKVQEALEMTRQGLRNSKIYLKP
eukprot:gene29137-32355_t